jgi:hypothetical protein
MSKHKVGDHIKDGTGVEWVVARIWEHSDHYDYDLINIITGDHGAFSGKKYED